jgi:hypothetical protein
MRRSTLLSLIAALGFLANPALADDGPPSAEEHQRIEAKLADLGFTSWQEIKWDDDGYWEIDDAIGSDGKYELKLHLDTLEVINQERDD